MFKLCFTGSNKDTTQKDDFSGRDMKYKQSSRRGYFEVSANESPYIHG